MTVRGSVAGQPPARGRWKIARTVDLAALLTIGYIATGYLVTPLPLIAVIVVLNDVVTITLATDRVQGTSPPQRWDVREIAKIGGALAVGWLALGFAILWVALNLLKLPTLQIRTLMFVYLMYSAQATIYHSRARSVLVACAQSLRRCRHDWQCGHRVRIGLPGAS